MAKEVGSKELLEYAAKKRAEWEALDSYGYEAGKYYLFRTVTMIYAGELVEEKRTHVKLKKAAWIADAGRWNEAVRNLKGCREVELYPPEKIVRVSLGGMLDDLEVDELPDKTV